MCTLSVLVRVLADSVHFLIGVNQGIGERKGLETIPTPFPTQHFNRFFIGVNPQKGKGGKMKGKQQQPERPIIFALPIK